MINPIETIRIYNPAGQAYYSDAARTSVEFPVTNPCERSAKLMGDDYVRLVFKLPNKVVFDTYAFIEYDGQTFFLKETYRPTPNGCLKETIDGKESVSSAYYSYDVKFVSIANMLTKPICYRHVVVKGAGGTQQTWDEPEISINGTLETLYQIIIGSIQQAASRLSASHYKDMLTSIATNGAFTNGAKPAGVQLTPNTKLVTFSFSGDNIANVCTSVANAYAEDGKDTEWYITEDANHSCTLHFAKCESADTAQVLSDYEWENNGTDRFARPYLNGGLKSVEYAQAWSDVPQVIVPYGADRNMSGISVVGIDETTQMQSTFGKRLRLDPNTTYNVHDRNGENATTVTTDAHGALSNPNVNTGIEVTKFYNDIYPQCHFKITKVEVKNKRQSGETVPEYTCEGIAVDARYTKEYLAQKGMFPLRIEEATTLSVRFESGFLNGREFEIANKTHKDQGSTGYSLKFTIVADGSIEDGTLIPSGNFKPNVGDQFALFNMKMPAEFVSLAKQDLAQRAYEELLDLQNTRPEVKCTAEPFTFMQHTVSFGAVMQVSSELFGDKPFISRVIAYSYKLTSPSSVQFSLASAVMQGTLSEMNNAISDVTHTAGGLEQRAINLSRRGWRDANEVADMLDSITSEMMLVGNERYQFGFTSSIECVDSSNKFASLRIGYGSLQHTQEPYINYANRGLWEISGATLTKDVNGADLDPDTPYYLFAQVADDTNPARLILTTDAHSSESEDDVPYLLLGILSSEFEDRRVFSRTNGYTAIEGGTITTEQIQDASRNLIIDFQSNPPRIIARNGAEIIGNVRFKASDTKTAEEQLRDLGIDVGNAQSTADDAKAAIDNLEVGGENLYTGDNPLTIAANNSNYNNQVLTCKLQNGEQYVFSCGKSVVKSGNTDKYTILLYDDTVTQNAGFGYWKLPVSATKVEKTFVVPNSGNWQIRLYAGEFHHTAGISIEFTDIMVQKGNKATEYQKPIRKFLYNGNVSIPYKHTDYAQSKLLASGVYAGTYYTEMASESKGAGVTTANRDAFMNSCLVWFVAGKQQTTENVLKITDWGEAVNISQRADVYVYTGQAAFVKSHIQAPTSTGVEFTANGTWTINGAKISAYKMEYLEGEAYEAKTKAEALDYLKAAMANGSTEVAGGLLMTNVLMLRDLANKVTAGLSGLTKYKPSGSSTTLEDLVLLWGGATYDEAFYAARNAGYLKKAGGDPITTLLKKDGTGKIGIFKISDTQAVIDVPNQGKVIIDASTANGGIFIKDSGGIDRVVISPLSLNSFGVASTHDLGTASILKNINENQSADESGTVSYSKSFTAGKSGTLESSFSVITYISASVSIERGKGYPSATSGYNSLTVSIKDTTNGTTVFTQSLSALSVTASANNTTNTNNNADSKTDGQTYPVSIKIQVIKGHNYTLSISGTAIVRTNAGGTPSQTYEVIVQSRLSITSNKAIKLLYTDMCAYLCVDGMSVAANSELKFDVMKSGTNLKVLAKGLPTSAPTAKGQLWQDSSKYIRIT